MYRDAKDHLDTERLLGALELVHRRTHDPQPLERVRLAHGQRCPHRSDPVPERAAVVLRSDGHGRHRLQRQPVDGISSLEHPAADASRDRSEH